MRLLNIAGLEVGGNLLGASLSDPTGDWENRDVIRINDEILRLFGGAWDDPPYMPEGWQYDERLDGLKKDATGIYADLIKDPRCCITLPFWEEVFYIKCVVIKKDIEAVAQALYKEDGMPLEQGRKLHNIYRDRIEENVRGKKIEVDYEELSEGNSAEIIKNILSELNVDVEISGNPLAPFEKGGIKRISPFEEGGSETKIFGLTKIRNEETIIQDTLDHWGEICTGGIYVYDDASTDRTVEICQDHSTVKNIYISKEWERDRSLAESEHRQKALDMAQKEAVPGDWFVYFDADERLFLKENVLSELNVGNADAVACRLYDVYITPEDVDKNYLEREYIGPEYRTIIFFFRNGINARFDLPDHRMPHLPQNAKVKTAGIIKHYGKGISVEQWESTCDYYIEHRKMFAEKWKARKGKAIKKDYKSDFGKPLIKFDSLLSGGIRGTPLENMGSSKSMKVLLMNNKLNYYGGTETSIYTIAEELYRLGCQIDIFTFGKGLMSEAIGRFGTVTDEPADEYDLILVNHNTCLERVKNIKGYKIMTCHGVSPELEQPVPGADSYVAISEEVQEHLKSKGFESTVIRNSINLERFSFKEVHNEKKRVLSLSKGRQAVEWLQEICQELGYGFGHLWLKTLNIEDYIKEADVVVSYGRGALEGLACGKNVVVYDARNYIDSYADDIITPENMNELAKNNFSGRRYKNKWTKEELKAKLQEAAEREYDCASLKEFDIKNNINKYLELYKNRNFHSNVTAIIPIVRKEKAQRCIDAIKSQCVVLAVEDTEKIGCPKMVNRLVGLTQTPLVMFLGDDTIPSPDIVTKALETMKTIKDGWGIVGLNDGTNRPLLPTHWLADKRMLPLLDGNFFNIEYIHNFCDNELGLRSQLLKKYAYSYDAKLVHNHPVFTGEKLDRFYIQSNQYFRRDEELFEKNKKKILGEGV